jgi:hypothetical protein
MENALEGNRFTVRAPRPLSRVKFEPSSNIESMQNVIVMGIDLKTMLRWGL